LLEALEIHERHKVLEIGTGCGIIALECARVGAVVVATDINIFATSLARFNYWRNCDRLRGTVEIRQGDLFSVVNPNEKFDVIIFNPPYLPTRPNERIGGSCNFNLAMDGGSDGLQLTERFIAGCKRYLQSNGYAYFVFSSLSDRDKLVRYLSRCGLIADVVLGRWYGDEKIDVYRIRV
jgi:release factor glutamine methyltransferase